MKKFPHICSLIIMILLSGVLNAQDREIIAFTDQQVYITGERIWISGKVANKQDGSENIVDILLLDRNGRPMERARLLSSQGYFQGNMQLSGTLASDFYVLQISVGTGLHQIIPVMIINPVMPPVTTAQGIVTAAAVQQDNPVSVSISKSVYAPREIVRLTLGQSYRELFVSVHRKDALSVYADSLIGSWKQEMADTVKMPADQQGMLIKVRVVEEGSGQPIEHALVFGSVLGDQANIATAVSGAGGEAQLLMPYVHSDLSFVLSAESNDGKICKVLKEDEIPGNFKPIALPALVLTERFRDDINERLINADVTNKYLPAEKIRYNTEGMDTVDFYGEPDKRYILDNYTRFPDMQEILQEFVTEVRVRRTNGKPVLQVFNTPFKDFFEQPAMVLLDGVPVHDIAQLLAIDPLKLKSIDVVARKFIIGDLQIPGIVHYKSYHADMAGFKLPSHALVYELKGPAIPVEPVFPDFSIRSDNRLPEFRNVLLWKTISASRADGLSFYTSDALGRYEIKVNAIDNFGRKYAGQVEIVVK